MSVKREQRPQRRLDRGRLALGLLIGFAISACESPRFATNYPAHAERPALEIFEHRFERRRLANGLHAIAVREPGAGSASIYVVYAVGTGQETAEVSGLSHLTEHLLFSGTQETENGAHERFVESIGGEANAFTRADYTFYYDDSIPVESLDRVLEMEADRMRNLSFEPAAVAFERERLVREEVRSASDRQRREQQIDRVVFGPVAYGSQLVDERGNTRAKDLAMPIVRAFYDRWYVPGQAAVVVVGDVDERLALDAIERAFAPLPVGPVIEHDPVPLERPKAEAPSPARFVEDLASPRVVHAWIGPRRRSATGDTTDRLALEVLARVHRAGRSEVLVSMGDRARADRFTLTAPGPRAGALVEETLASLRSTTVSPAELAAAVESIEREWAAAPLRGRPYFSLAGRVGILSALGDPEYLIDGLKALRALTPEQVRRVAERWLAPEARFVVHFVPDGLASPHESAVLPDSADALVTHAERATDSGDLAAAARAYRRLADGSEDLKMRVIALYSLAQVERQGGRLVEARAALVEALALVDYPAVRALLGEVEEELRTGERTPAATGERSKDEALASAVSSFGVANPEGLAPEIVSRAEEWMRRVERWRGLPFLEDLRIEYGVEGEDEHLAGFYSPVDRRLVVMAGRSETFSNGTLLHEIVHALQDQHFDLARLHREAASPDAQHALSALIEGEAMLAVADLMQYDFLSHATPFQGYPVDRDRFDRVFRYAEGMRLVMALRESGGWSRVDEAWRSPPDRTVEVLQPGLWLRAVAAGEAGDERARTTHGAYAVFLFLGEDETSRPHARTLAASLVGDEIERADAGPATESPHRWTLYFATEEAARRFRELTADRKDVRLVPSTEEGTRVAVDLYGAWLP